MSRGYGFYGHFGDTSSITKYIHAREGDGAKFSDLRIRAAAPFVNARASPIDGNDRPSGSDPLAIVRRAHAAHSEAFPIPAHLAGRRPQKIEASMRNLPLELQEAIFEMAHDGDRRDREAGQTRREQRRLGPFARLKWRLLARRFPMACHRLSKFEPLYTRGYGDVEMVTVTYGEATIVCPEVYAARVNDIYAMQNHTTMMPWTARKAYSKWTAATPWRDMAAVYVNGFTHSGTTPTASALRRVMNARTAVQRGETGSAQLHAHLLRR